MPTITPPGSSPARSPSLPSLTVSITAAPGGRLSICMPSQLTGRAEVIAGVDGTMAEGGGVVAGGGLVVAGGGAVVAGGGLVAAGGGVDVAGGGERRGVGAAAWRGGGVWCLEEPTRALTPHAAADRNRM